MLCSCFSGKVHFSCHLLAAEIAFILSTPCQLQEHFLLLTQPTFAEAARSTEKQGDASMKMLLQPQEQSLPLQKQVPAFIICLTLALEMKWPQQPRRHSVSLGV